MRAPVERLFFVLLAATFPVVTHCQNANAARPRPPLPEYVQEFFLSDAVRNQDRGELQFTLGVDSRQKIGTSTSLKMEYGVTGRFQIGVELPYGMTEEERVESSSNWSSTSMGFQYQLSPSTSPLQFRWAWHSVSPSQPAENSNTSLRF